MQITKSNPQALQVQTDRAFLWGGRARRIIGHREENSVSPSWRWWRRTAGSRDATESRFQGGAAGTQHSRGFWASFHRLAFLSTNQKTPHSSADTGELARGVGDPWRNWRTLSLCPPPSPALLPGLLGTDRTCFSPPTIGLSGAMPGTERSPQ